MNDTFAFRLLIQTYVFPIQRKLSPSETSTGLLNVLHSFNASTVQLINIS